MIKNSFPLYNLFLSRVSQGKNVHRGSEEFMFPECAQNAGNLLPDHRALLPTWSNGTRRRRSSKGTVTGKPQGKLQGKPQESDIVGNGEMHGRIFLQSTFTYIYFSRLKRNLWNITIWSTLKEQIFLRQTSQRQEWMNTKRTLRTSETDHAELFASHYQAPGTQVLAWSSIYSKPQGLPTQLSKPISLGTRWLVTWVLKGTFWDE